MEDTIIKFENVSYRYEGEENEKLPLAVDNVSFEIHKGEFVAIIGSNGSGKSTITRLCNAMEIPESGKIFVNGIDTADESDSENELKIRTNVGVVMQNPDNQIVATIVEEDVAFGPENLGVPQNELRQRVDDALRQVNMYDYRNHEPHKLSGGQKQRVAIAGVLAMQTECIVLDEPTAMLDPIGRKEVMATIKELNKKGFAIVLITHFMEEAAQADKIIVMNHGKKILEGTPAQVFTKEDTLTKCGLAIPPAAALASALRKKGLKLPLDILTPDDFAENYIKLVRRGK